MVDIPFPQTSAPGRRPGEGAGVLYNCFVEKQGEGAIWRRMPGLSVFASLPDGPVRGAVVVGGVIFVVAGRTAIVVDRNGGVRALDGTVEGDGPVTMARNNAADPAIAVTTNVGNYILTNLAVQAYPDGDVPQANSVRFLDGFLLWTTRAGDCWSSEVNETTVSALNFQRAEARPDGLLTGFTHQQAFFAAGDSSIEVYQNTGNQTGFPFTRSTVIAVGIASSWAVAGFEEGWDGEPIFVAADNTVRTLNGLRPARISNADIEADIAAVSDKALLRACVFTFGGNAIWSLSSPDWTWQFNVTTGSWIKRESHEKRRWLGEFSLWFNGRWLVSDAFSNRLLVVDENSPFEAGEPLIFGLDSAAVKQFPAKIRGVEAFFDFTLGHGDETGQDPIETNPQVMLSWSHDGGAKWSNPLHKSLRRQGHFIAPIRQTRVGLTSHHGIRWRWRVSDPVPVAFIGGRMDAQERRP